MLFGLHLSALQASINAVYRYLFYTRWDHLTLNYVKL